MGMKREFAFHIRHKKTLEHRIVKVEAETVYQAHSDEVGYKKEWTWSGSEPWKNVADKVECIGGKMYRFKIGAKLMASTFTAERMIWCGEQGYWVKQFVNGEYKVGQFVSEKDYEAFCKAIGVVPELEW